MADEKPKVSVAAPGRKKRGCISPGVRPQGLMGNSGRSHAARFTLLKLRAKIQLPAILTLDRKVRERASAGAQVAFCMITRSPAAGLVRGACPV